MLPDGWMRAIRVEDLSKEYFIGTTPRGRETLREALSEILFSPWRRYRRLKGEGTGAERFLALKEISFEVGQGEVVGIIGRNGAGKSTLLKILSEITAPTSGRIELHGRTSSLLEVGTGFHPELTGRENIYLNGAVLGMKKAEIVRKFDEIVSFAEVEKFLDTPVKHYSSGMYVRLAFAIAAHLEPEILIVDEVLAVGDAQFQKKCLGRMNEIGRAGRTVLLVSHNMNVIQSLCGRAIWLDEGAVAFDGPARAAVIAYSEYRGKNIIAQSWEDAADPPGNESVRLLRARVVPAEESAGESLTVRTAFRVEFAYRLLEDIPVFNLVMHFRTVDGTTVFVTAADPRRISAGTYRSDCRIPGDLLNNGKYTMELIFGKDGNIVLYKAENPLVFEVHDAERSPGSFLGEIPGIVRPKLAWDTRTVE